MSSRRGAWIVVLAESGIPASVELFPTKQRANHRAGQLRAGTNPEDDEVAVFQRMLPQQG